MRIAILAWGSLIWSPDALAIQGDWNPDGPQLPIEFARISNNGRLTLVLVPDAEPVTTYWALSLLQSLDDAVEDLLVREGTVRKNIGWTNGTDCSPTNLHPDVSHVIETCLQNHNHHCDAVIWTNLPEKFSEVTGRPRTIAESIAYLQNLHGEARLQAETYIRRAPPQIQTPLRHAVEQELGWTYQA